MDVIKPFDASGIRRDASGCAHYVRRPTSLVQMLRDTVDRLPDGEAVKEVGARSVTFAELWAEAAQVAGGLATAGVARGDRVALRLENGVKWCVAFFATQLAGAVAVPTNTALTGAEADYILGDAGARLCLDTSGALPHGAPLVVEDLAADEPSAIFYTSGTTGVPKGAVTTHANFLSNTETVRRILDFPAEAEGIRNFAAAPLFTVTACNSQLLPMCELGGTTVTLPRFEPEAFVRAIGQERLNLLLGSPGMYRLAFNHPAFREVDTSSVRWAVYGAAPASPEFLHYMAEAFPSAAVEAAFGLTEVASVATYLPSPYAREYPASVGFAAPIVDLDLADKDPQTGVGELLVRGGNVVPGYWNKPEATAATFVDGWMHTGDLARIDEQGLTYIVDRKKDMINRGGENVYSVEVENVLSQHPSVLEVAVVGVTDEVLGERVGAVLVPTPGSSIDPAAVVAAAAERLAAFKLPQYIAVRSDPLPRNPGGKIVKPVLRKTTKWRPVTA